MWLDSGLTELVPGRGYLYSYNGTTSQTLNFGSGAKGRGQGMKSSINTNKLVKHTVHDLTLTPVKKVNIKEKKLSTTIFINFNKYFK
jgi:hypothetical protein